MFHWAQSLRFYSLRAAGFFQEAAAADRHSPMGIKWGFGRGAPEWCATHGRLCLAKVLQFTDGCDNVVLLGL